MTAIRFAPWDIPLAGHGESFSTLVSEPACDRGVAAQPHPVEVEIHWQGLRGDPDDHSLGGLGSFWGALLGGIALGMAQLIGLKFDPNAGLLYAHLLFFVMLLIRPAGLISNQA